MPEIPFYRYPVIDDSACREKLYILLAIFLASRHVGDLCERAADGNGGIFRQILDEHEMSLATRLLIECAVLIRMKDDAFLEQHGMSAETHKDIVGTLSTGADLSECAELNLREACNKIVHAKRMNFDFEQDPGWESRYLVPTVHLYGEHRSLEWKAELDVIQFVECGCTMFPC
jgi:hypothetical protein